MNNNWISSQAENLPDFIIIGAMKSATTTLHTILNKHPDVFIPNGEPHFFDMDNFFEHNDFNHYDKLNDKWYSSFDEQLIKTRFDEYHNLFKNHKNKIKGEDSTVYLASKKALKRISLQKKEIKIIVMLRNPTSRAYSNYYHLLKSGKAFFSFEDTIQFMPEKILTRSIYNKQLEYLFKYFPRKRVKILVFEDFINNPKNMIKELSDFLNIDFNKFKKNVFDEKANSSKLPKFEKLKYIFSRNFPHFSKKFRQYKILKLEKKKDSIFLRLLFILHNIINPVREKKPQKMKLATKDFLDKFFLKELSGLNELVGFNILDKWFPNK